MSKPPMDDSNKFQIQSDFVSKLIDIVERELDNIGDAYSGFGPNRRSNFKKALCNALSADAPPAPVVSTNVPSKVVPVLNNLGFSELQTDTILSLISLPENSTLSWWDNYNYAERLRDGRGWTVTLYGACSGTGDLLMILQSLQKINPNHKLVKFIPAMKKAKGENVSGLEDFGKVLSGLGNDEEWQEAVWDVYIDMYWNFAADFADKKNSAKNRPGPAMTTPLTRGFMVDVALNHGAYIESFNPIIKKMKNKDEPNETKWFMDFCEARRQMLKAGIDDLDTSKTGDRCTLWKNILQEGNADLDRAINCYKGYWSNNTVVLK